MQFAQIRAQWTKLQVLTTVLPAKLLSHIEQFAALPQASAGEACYYRAKLRLIDIYGEKPQESYDKATRLVLETTPSELARRITELICDHIQKSLEGCCCAKTVVNMAKTTVKPCQTSHCHHAARRRTTGADSEGCRCSTPFGCINPRRTTGCATGCNRSNRCRQPERNHTSTRTGGSVKTGKGA